MHSTTQGIGRNTTASLLVAILCLFGGAGGVHRRALATPPVTSSCGQEKSPGTDQSNDGTKPKDNSSEHPVRYVDGMLMYRIRTVDFPVGGEDWSFKLHYMNRPIDVGAQIEEGYGSNWVPNLLRLEPRGASKIYAIVGDSATEYTLSNGEWLGQNGAYAHITQSSPGADFVLHGTRGGAAAFFGSGELEGRIKSIRGPYGESWDLTYYGAGNGGSSYKLDQIVDPTGRSWKFYWRNYYPHYGKLYSIVVRLGFKTLASFYPQYYDSTIAGVGIVGDLKTMRITSYQTSPSVSRTTYFRYHTQVNDDGNPHDLKYIIHPNNYERGVRLYGSNLDSWTDQDIEVSQLYDYKIHYDSSHRVTSEWVSSSCSCASGGPYGRFDYEYQTQAASGDYNLWATAVRQTNPDGSCKFVETNFLGSAITVVHQADCNDDMSARYATVHEYEAEGLIYRTYHPSACDPSGYAYPSPLSGPGTVATHASAGRVDEFSYTLFAGNDRPNSGRLTSTAVKIGSSGPPALTRENVYTLAGSGRGVWPDEQRYYPVAGQSQAMVKAYTFHNSDVYARASITTTFPSVSNPATLPAATLVESIGSDGALDSVTDQHGIVTDYSYAPDTGLPLSVVVDSVPGGLQIRTEYEHDDWGSLTASTTFDALGGVRKRQFIRRTVLRKGSSGGTSYDYRPVTLSYDHLTVDGSGNVTGREGLLRIFVDDLEGNSLEVAAGYLPPDDAVLADDFDNSSANLTLEAAFQGRLYGRTTNEYDAGSLRRSHEWNDAEDLSAGRLTTEYEYDLRGRRVRTLSPSLTIHRAAYSPLGWPTSESVGTDDSPGTSNMTQIETRVFHNDGRLQQVLGVDGSVEEYEYDERDRVVAVSTTLAGGAEEKWRRSEFAIDNLGRVTSRTQYWAVRDSGGQWRHYYSSDDSEHLWIVTSTRFLDERGRVWKGREQHTPVVDAQDGYGEPGTPGLPSEVAYWRNQRSELIKQQHGDAAFEKHQYDAAGRRSKWYVAIDSDEGSSFAEADDVSGDVVVQQENSHYPHAGAVEVREILLRNDQEDASWTEHTGALDSAAMNAYRRRVYHAYWYDRDGELDTLVDYGENGGQTLSAPLTPPTHSSGVRHRTDFSRGWTEANGSNKVWPGQPASWWWTRVETRRSDTDTRIDYQFFDNLDREVRTIEAFDDGTPSSDRDITAELVYNASGRLWRRIAHDVEFMGTTATQQITEYTYGVQATGTNPSELASNDLLRTVSFPNGASATFAYDVAYRLKWVQDEHGNEREFSYDLTGRLTEDRLEVVGPNTDGRTRRRVVEYESRDRRAVISTYDATAGGTRLTHIERVFGDQGHPHEYRQKHGDAATQTLRFHRSQAASGHPLDERYVLDSFEYPVSGRRVYQFFDFDSADADWENKDAFLSRTTGYSAGAGGSSPIARYDYSGLWTVTAVEFPALSSPVRVDSTVSQFATTSRLRAAKSGTDFVDFALDHNDVGSLESAIDSSPVSQVHPNATYQYDLLERLTRVDFSDGDDRAWELTAVHNWDTVRDNGTLADDRSHSVSNQITTRPVGGGVPTYGPGGNALTLPDDAGGAHDIEIAYDGWGAAVKYSDNGTTLLETLRDGLGRIVTREVPGSDDQHLFYAGSWSVVTIASLDGSTWSIDREYVWGRHDVDEILCSYDAFGSKVSFVQDDNQNVIAALNESGDDFVQIRYDSYGKPNFFVKIGSQYFDAGDTTPPADLELLYQARPYAYLSGSQGQAIRVYDYRTRTYSVALGRFLQEDLRGGWHDLGNSGNAYAFVHSRPLVARDPWGDKACVYGSDHDLKANQGDNKKESDEWTKEWNRRVEEAGHPEFHVDRFIGGKDQLEKAIECLECCDDLVIHAHGRTDGRTAEGIVVAAGEVVRWEELKKMFEKQAKKLAEAAAEKKKCGEGDCCRVRSLVLLACKVQQAEAKDLGKALNACWVWYSPVVSPLDTENFPYVMKEKGGKEVPVYDPRDDGNSWYKDKEAQDKGELTRLKGVATNGKKCCCPPYDPPPDPDKSTEEKKK